MHVALGMQNKHTKESWWKMEKMFADETVNSDGNLMHKFVKK